MEELQRNSADENKNTIKNPFIIILDNVRSMNNVGAVFRTADAFGVEAIYLCGVTPTPPHRDIHKTALGATESVNWKYFTSTIDAVHEAKENDYEIIAIEQAHNSTPLNQINTTGKKAFLFGNEVSGVNDKALEQANACIEIPQWGAKHSLNISVSVGVVLWELVRLQGL